MNVRRGLHRIFIVVCVLWVAAALVVPPWLAVREVHQWYRDQLAQIVKLEPASYLAAFENLQDMWHTRLAEARYSAYWKELADEPLYALLLLVAPPAVLYGIVYGLIALVIWIWRGFQRPAS
jgi:hypothetical protein